jgi:hypothetical protein
LQLYGLASDAGPGYEGWRVDHQLLMGSVPRIIDHVPPI